MTARQAVLANPRSDLGPHNPDIQLLAKKAHYKRLALTTRDAESHRGTPKTDVVRTLEWFHKHPRDALVGKAEIAISLIQLQTIFSVNPISSMDPDMFDSYKVESEHVGALQLFVNHRIRLTLYDYFVSCFAHGSK